MSEAVKEDLKDERVPQCLQWTCEDVANWIEELGFPCYKDCMLTNKVNGRKLVQVEASQLPKLGITDFQHIKTITKSIRDHLTVEDPFWNRSISLPPREELGMYLEMKCTTGEKADGLTFKEYLLDNEAIKWQPPLANHCLILPHD